MVSNIGDAVGDGNRGKIGTGAECIGLDTGYRFGNFIGALSVAGGVVKKLRHAYVKQCAILVGTEAEVSVRYGEVLYSVAIGER